MPAIKGQKPLLIIRLSVKNLNTNRYTWIYYDLICCQLELEVVKHTNLNNKEVYRESV